MEIQLSVFSQMTTLDVLALAWFFVGWITYSAISDRGFLNRQGLTGISHTYRLEWARQLVSRDTRIVDAALTANLMHSISFYANATMYIIVGLIAVLSTLDRATVASVLPFGLQAGRALTELKFVVLLGVLVVAYFKFTWALRQFNLVTILIGAAPPATAPEPDQLRYAERLAALITLGGDEFNRGLRAYYFGLAAASWLIQPWLFVVATTVIILILYRREFSSRTCSVLL